MPKADKTVLLFALSWLGTVLLLFAGLLRLPTFFSERANLVKLKSAISDRRAIEDKLKKFIADFRNHTDAVKAEISRREKLIADRSFQCRGEEQIPDFISELQLIFADAGAAVVNLGYEKRQSLGNYIVLPFAAEFKADYHGMRKLIHALETHPAGIIINKLEFISLNNEEHKVRLKTECSARFRKIGQ